MTTAEKLLKIVGNRQKLYDAGKQAEYDRNWDKHQNSGRKENYNYSFAGTWWNDDTFRPKYNMANVISANNMFCFAQISDLKGVLERCGVTMDLRRADPAGYLFNGMTSLTRVPVVNLSGVTAGNYRLDNVFNGDRNLWYIEKFIIRHDGLNTFNNVFNNCSALSYFRMEGVIGNNVSFSSCPLDRESIMGEEITEEEYGALTQEVQEDNVITFRGKKYYGGIVAALSLTVTGKKLTIKKTAKEAAFSVDDWDELIALRPNWTFELL